MKKFLLIGVLFFSGCLMRTYVADQSRVDMDTDGGNHGYVVGKQTSTEGKVFKFGKVRKVAVMEFELGSHKPKDLNAQPKQEVVVSDDYTSSPVQDFSETTLAPEPMAASENSYTEYTVTKNDTLQKISQKFYGTTKKWYKLFQENKDVLSSPDKIYPGLVIKVPNN